MNILMMTNTFTPHVGGVARSVAAFAESYRGMGHQVLVVAPVFPHTPVHEQGVVRVPALQNFNGSDFSVVLPVSAMLQEAIDDFRPEVVHTHHPFLIGSTALRVASLYQLPLAFTHHTMYERYTHYVPGDSPALKRFVIGLSTAYANLCDQVFAPSESIAGVLKERGVTAPLAVLPTGVDVAFLGSGDGGGFRAARGIPSDAFLVGHLGRLAREKNLGFLARSVASFVGETANAHFLVAGSGPSGEVLDTVFAEAGLGERLHRVGVLEGHALADAYRAMDVFAFASTSETQGMVLSEAMAAGTPVVALDAPGVREVVRDGDNGYLLMEASEPDFARALARVAVLSPAEMKHMRRQARGTAEAVSMEHTARRALDHYQRLRRQGFVARPEAYTNWDGLVSLIKGEWELLKGMAGAAGAALGPEDGEPLGHDAKC